MTKDKESPGAGPETPQPAAIEPQPVQFRKALKDLSREDLEKVASTLNDKLQMLAGKLSMTQGSANQNSVDITFGRRKATLIVDEVPTTKEIMDITSMEVKIYGPTGIDAGLEATNTLTTFLKYLQKIGFLPDADIVRNLSQKIEEAKAEAEAMFTTEE